MWGYLAPQALTQPSSVMFSAHTEAWRINRGILGALSPFLHEAEAIRVPLGTPRPGRGTTLRQRGLPPRIRTTALSSGENQLHNDCFNLVSFIRYNYNNLVNVYCFPHRLVPWRSWRYSGRSIFRSKWHEWFLRCPWNTLLISGLMICLEALTLLLLP